MSRHDPDLLPIRVFQPFEGSTDRQPRWHWHEAVAVAAVVGFIVAMFVGVVA